MNEETTEENTSTPATRKGKKLSKSVVPGNPIVTIEVMTAEEGPIQFDFSSLPQDMQDHLGPFGLGHKLGDAAAGKDGAEAVEAIQKVWEGLMESNFSTRVAGERITKKSVAEKLDNLPEDEKEAARAVLEELGLI